MFLFTATALTLPPPPDPEPFEGRESAYTLPEIESEEASHVTNYDTGSIHNSDGHSGDSEGADAAGRDTPTNGGPLMSDVSANADISAPSGALAAPISNILPGGNPMTYAATAVPALRPNEKFSVANLVNPL